MSQGVNGKDKNWIGQQGAETKNITQAILDLVEQEKNKKNNLTPELKLISSNFSQSHKQKFIKKKDHIIFSNQL